jgi:hypothetical protein
MYLELEGDLFLLEALQGGIGYHAEVCAVRPRDLGDVSGDVLGSFQISDCVSRHTQLIWTHGMQESVLFVLGDLLGVL